MEGTGSAVPAKVMTNGDFEQLVDTSDEWIVQRTGIRERRVTTPEETTGSLSVIAAKRALEAARVRPEELDLIVLATVTGDYPWPATSCLVQAEIGARNAGAFDVSAACAGFIYGMANVSAMIETGQIRKALMIGADTLTKVVDWTDRSTCILFGDGAAACVLGTGRGTDRGVISTVLKADGRGVPHILMERGGAKWPACLPESA